MSDLFMRRSAIIGGVDHEYRYELRRIWDDALPLLVVCMLNPSRADHEIDDPTILTLIHFGKLWGYGGLLIVNLYALRSSSPAVMFAAGAAAMGVDNEKHLLSAMVYAAANGGNMLAAWGNDGAERTGFFCQVALDVHRLTLLCLGRTQSGAPKHPMARGKHRIPRDMQPQIWREPASLAS